MALPAGADHVAAPSATRPVDEETRPLYADPFSGNTGSVRLLEKCGFERTGTVTYGDAEHIMLVLH